MFTRILLRLLAPIQREPAFFCCMLVLSAFAVQANPLNRPYVCAVFLVTYGGTWLASTPPQNASKWLQAAICAVVYPLSLMDCFCFSFFHSCISQTIFQVVGETNPGEAGEFLATYLTPRILFSRVGVVLAVLLFHIACLLRGDQMLAAFRCRLPRLWAAISSGLSQRVAACCLAAVLGVSLCYAGRGEIFRLYKGFAMMFEAEKLSDISDFDTGMLFPVERLVTSAYTNRLHAAETGILIESQRRATVSGCTYRSPVIVLVIGESYNKHHSHLYGYAKETTPWQDSVAASGQLIPFDDVVTPYNTTSSVFTELLSTHTVGAAGEWCDSPLFTTLMRRAGYHTMFITNQFVRRVTQTQIDFKVGPFLEDSTVLAMQFCYTNHRVYPYDEQLLDDYRAHRPAADTRHRLIIFHLIGQHNSYSGRYPAARARFVADDYAGTGLSRSERETVAHYDNATLYNDHVLRLIAREFSDDDAILIYLPDHGESVYDEGRPMVGRYHGAVTAYVARYQYEIPLWIMPTRHYMSERPEVVEQIRRAAALPLMSDRLPHMMLWLAGVDTPCYQPEMNPMSGKYRPRTPRAIAGTTDYDRLTKTKHP